MSRFYSLSAFIVFASIFIGVVILHKSVRISVVNDVGQDICIDYVKSGDLKYLRGEDLQDDDFRSFLSFLNFDNRIHARFQINKCEENGEYKDLYCEIESSGSDSCQVYLQSGNSIDCTECYK